MLSALGLLFVTAAGACHAEKDAAGPRVVVRAERGPVTVRVELATTPEQRARGLMWRKRLDADAGMLFVFPESAVLSFWMKNTPLPLDILYIAEDGRVVSIAENTKPYSETSLPSAGPARYVLEVNAGFSRAHGIGPGTRIELPNDSASRRSVR